MSAQIFKQIMPIDMLFQLLHEICSKNDKYFVFNLNAFKKGIYNETIPNFIISCSDYYHASKRKYLERKLTYNSFTTVLRQICNLNKTTYTSQIKYDKSRYDIVYFIYF